MNNRLFLTLGLAAALGCPKNDGGSSRPASAPAAAPLEAEPAASEAARSPPPAAPGCERDEQCRAFSSYCEGCVCLVLSAGEPDPKCPEEPVSCLVDPCRDREARCVEGHCRLTEPFGEEA